MSEPLSAPVTHPLLQVEHLDICYGQNPALRDVNFTLNQGRCTAIVGESGSGKTTLVKAILGLLGQNARITNGRILWQGQQDLTKDSAARRALLGNEIAYVPQSPNLSFDPRQSVGRQIAEPLSLRRKLSAPWQKVAADMLDSVGIQDPQARVHLHPWEMSGGMLQRGLIASALSTTPKLVLADEPTAALDMLSQERVLALIDSQIRGNDTALLLITHDLGVALDRADDIIVMREGQIVEAGPIRTITETPQSPYTRRLFTHVQQATGAISRETRDHTAPVAAPLLELRAVGKLFASPKGQPARGLYPISLSVPRGRTTVLVGESGSGKSTAANLVIGQLAADSGEILLDGKLLAHGPARWKGDDWRRVQMIHQDPLSTFNPRFSVADILAEPLRNLGQTEAEIAATSLSLLDAVGLSLGLLPRVARSLSGGQGQRLAIARALAIQPKLLILDEAVSALDVLVRDHILDLLKTLQTERGLGYLFITHDLSVARDIADEIIVMQSGHVIERGTPDALWRDPRHDYTRRLIAAIPGQAFLKSHLRPATATASAAHA